MAGKIPQNFIDDLLDRTDIVELVDSRVKLKKTGRNYSACCPFHDEKTPSFSVNPDKQFYYCFGCGAGGNAVSFLMDYERTDFVETIENLARMQGVEVPREEESAFQREKQQSKKSIYSLLEQASTYYQQQLRHHSQKIKVIDYLKQRGLSGEIAKQFGIGYAPPGWDNLLKQLGQSEENKKLLIEGGMLIEKDDGKGCYDRFRDRLIFPIRDNRGRVIGFGGRVFGDEKPKYLNSPETPVFHKQHELYGLYEARQANRHLERLIMVEGYMDVVALAQFEISYAVATLGTAAGSSHMEKVFRHCSEVVFCFDGDEAGRKAADRALEAVIPLMEAGRQARFLFLPDGEDPDTLIRSQGKDHFLWLIDQAPTLSEYLFSSCSKNLDLSRPDDRAKLINNIMPQIKAMPAGTFQALILRSLSDKTGLPIEDIKALEAVEPQPVYDDEPPPWLDQGDDDYPPADQPSEKRSRKPRARAKLAPSDRQLKRTPEKLIGALLLLYPQFGLLDNRIREIAADNADIELLHELLDFIKAHPNTNTGAILGHWMSTNSDGLNRLLQINLITENPEHLQQEFKEACEQLLHIKSRNKNSDLIQGIDKTSRMEDLSDAQKEAFLAIFQQKK